MKELFVLLQTKGALKIFLVSFLGSFVFYTYISLTYCNLTLATGELLRDKSVDPINSFLWVIVLSLGTFRYCSFCGTDSILIYPCLTDAGETVRVLTVAPAQMTAPVQLETLPVAVCGADG